MGVLRSRESYEAEVEELMQMMRCSIPSSSPCIQGLKGKGFSNSNSIATATSTSERRRMIRGFRREYGNGELGANASEMTRVCVTSGISFLGFAVANRLLSRGYTVRLLLDTQEDLDKVREMGMLLLHDDDDDDVDDDDDMEISNDNNINREWASATAVVADMMDVDSLCEAFAGCSCVFHTSAFTDPTGVSGYSEKVQYYDIATEKRAEYEKAIAAYIKRKESGELSEESDEYE